MVVGYLTSQYPAASHTFIRREIEALRRHGIQVVTFSVWPPSEGERSNPEDARAYSSTSYVFPIDWLAFVRAHLRGLLMRPRRYFSTFFAAFAHRVPGLRAFVYAFFYFAEAVLLASRLERAGVRHLHNHFANPAANVGYLASRYLGLRWSLTLHGLSDFDYPSRLLLSAKAHTAEFVACVSLYGRAQGFRILPPALWSKLLLVRCGVELGIFPPRSSTARARPLMITVGRLAPEKGQLGLLDAFAMLVRRGLDADLRFIGDGPMRAALEERIAAFGLSDRCVLVGRKPESEVLRELAEADVFVLSSFMEGLPVVLMEALALELAVLAPCVAGVPELVEHERTGLLFSAGDWDGLAASLERLSSDAELRERLGRAGRVRVEQEFDVNRAVLPLVERFRSHRS